MKAILDKYKSTVENLDEKSLYGIFAGILVFVFLVYYFLFLGPQLASLSKITPEIKLKAEEIRSAKNDIKRVNDYKKQLEELQAKLAEVNVKVKSKYEFPVILENISKVALASGVKIDQIMPNPHDQELLLENKETKYFSFPILVEARSSYHNFGRFLNRIEKEDMILNVGTFTISSSNNSKNHTIKMTLKAIVFEDKLEGNL